QGLQKTKGVRHDGDRDRLRLEEAVRHARTTTPLQEGRVPSLRDRSMRTRDDDGLSPAQRASMREIGRFRTILTADFIRIHYRGDAAAWRQDAAGLARQGLIEQRSVVIATHSKEEGRKTRSVSVMVLTKKGRNLLKRTEKELKDAGQALYAGFV